MDFRSLLPLQAVDQLLAQLEHRKAQLPERAVAASSTAALQMARTELRRLEKRQGDITGEINRLEVRGKELDAKKAKYEAQLKSVIALREAEALQHEIAGVAGSIRRWMMPNCCCSTKARHWTNASPNHVQPFRPWKLPLRKPRPRSPQQ